jgi:hypothetical protein
MQHAVQAKYPPDLCSDDACSIQVHVDLFRFLYERSKQHASVFLTAHIFIQGFHAALE